MAETHVISALLDKRARILGQIKAARFTIMRLQMELAHVDSVIRMFKPEQDLEAVKPKATAVRSNLLPKGAATCSAMEILRETGEALTAEQLATAVLIRAGLEVEPRSVELLGKSIHSSLRRQRHPIASYDRGTWPGKWTIKR